MRLALFDDLDHLVDLTGRLLSASSIPQTMDEARVREVMTALITRQDAVVWVTEQGFIAASIEHTVISYEPIVVEHGWYAEDGKGLKLLRALEAWADGRRIRLSTGTNGVDLSRIGYTAVETAWIK